MINVLVACEESQRVCVEFRKLGVNAFSCDILECSGNHPEWHIQDDVRKFLYSPFWDVIIAFPPCTHLCGSGQRWFSEGRKDRKLQYDAIEFFNLFTKLDCHYVAIENPVGIMSSYYRKPNQIIQPWMFGETDYKRTCLWLKNLPCLIPTDIIPVEKRTKNNHKAIFNGKSYSYNDPIVSVLRSKTYPGIARAMAFQWTDFLVNQEGFVL